MYIRLLVLPHHHYNKSTHHFSVISLYTFGFTISDLLRHRSVLFSWTTLAQTIDNIESEINGKIASSYNSSDTFTNPVVCAAYVMSLCADLSARSETSFYIKYKCLLCFISRSICGFVDVVGVLSRNDEAERIFVPLSVLPQQAPWKIKVNVYI